MERQPPAPNAPRTPGAPPALEGATGKLPYEPPMVTFVPLQIEERLMACTKMGTCASDIS